jgi:hypothetical protein
MTTIAEDFMKQMMTKSKSYSLVILKATPKRTGPGVEKIAWEHARRNFSLRADGLLSIICPVADGSDFRGIGIFGGTVEETKNIMDADPGVQAGIFVHEVHPCRSFPGDSLP